MSIDLPPKVWNSDILTLQNLEMALDQVVHTENPKSAQDSLKIFLQDFKNTTRREDRVDAFCQILNHPPSSQSSKIWLDDRTIPSHCGNIPINRILYGTELDEALNKHRQSSVRSDRRLIHCPNLNPFFTLSLAMSSSPECFENVRKSLIFSLGASTSALAMNTGLPTSFIHTDLFALEKPVLSLLERRLNGSLFWMLTWASAYTVSTTKLYWLNENNTYRDHCIIVGVIGTGVVFLKMGVDFEEMIIRILPGVVLLSLLIGMVIHGLVRWKHAKVEYRDEKDTELCAGY